MDTKIAKMNDNNFLERITINPQIFNGKPIIRYRRLALNMLNH
jgi:uncharacterized protein (DUF433 family)